MTNEAAREIFNKAIHETTDADAIAKIEIAREFFTNKAFREWLSDYTWKANNG